MSEQPPRPDLRRLLAEGLALLEGDETVESWKELLWDLNKAIRAHIAEMREQPEMPASENSFLWRD